MRILIFLSKSPADEFIRSQIERAIGGEEWQRLNKFLKDLKDLGLIEVFDRKKSIGHDTFKITERGRETVARFLSPENLYIRKTLGTPEEADTT
jgi:DNA-binding PadR family transcriptional regulator